MTRIQEKSFFKIGLVILMFSLIFFMIMGFGSFQTESLVNIFNKEEFIMNEHQTFDISMRTVNPEQFKTNHSFREQFGRWRIEDEKGNIISTGTSRKMYDGLYDSLITIQVPEDYPETYLITEIIEIQYFLSDTGNLVSDNGTIRGQEIFSLPIQSCTQSSDCDVTNACFGQELVCESNMCKLEGECIYCETDNDCPEKTIIGDVTKEYECISSECRVTGTKTIAQEFREIEPITNVPRSESGQELDRPEAPLYLKIAVIVQSLFLGYMIWRKNRG